MDFIFVKKGDFMSDADQPAQYAATSQDFKSARLYRISNHTGFDICVTYADGTKDIFKSGPTGTVPRLIVAYTTNHNEAAKYEDLKWLSRTVPASALSGQKIWYYKGLLFVKAENAEIADSTRFNPKFVSTNRKTNPPMLDAECNIYDTNTDRIYISVANVVYPVKCTHNLDIPESLIFNYSSNDGYRTIALDEYPELKINFSDYRKLQTFEVDFDTILDVPVKVCSNAHVILDSIESEQKILREKLKKLEEQETKLDNAEKELSLVNAELANTKRELTDTLDPERKSHVQKELETKRDISNLNFEIANQKRITSAQDGYYSSVKASTDASTTGVKALAVVTPIVATAAVATYKLATDSSNVISNAVRVAGAASVAAGAASSGFAGVSVCSMIAGALSGNLAMSILVACSTTVLGAVGGVVSGVLGAASKVASGIASCAKSVWNFFFG